MKRLFLYVVISNIILLNNMFSVHAMELSLEVKKGVEIDWAHKKRDTRSSCCWVEKNDKKYPYFLEKDDGNAKSSLVSDTKIIQKYNQFLGGNYDVSSLTDEQKSTLWYVLQTVQQGEMLTLEGKDNCYLRIEGRDKKFAQKMLQRIVNLPLEIRQEIDGKYGRNTLCNRNYEPSCWDVLLDDEWNKNDCAHITSEWGMCACHTASLCCALNDMIGCKGLFLCFSLATSVYFQHWVHSKAMSWLSETPEEKDRRHGFEAISLLEEMECKIVEAKEKVD